MLHQNSTENQNKPETLSQKLKPLIVEMTTELTSSHPNNVPEFLLHYIQNKNNFTNSGLTPSQRFELENLRNEISKYKKMEEHEKFMQENKEQKDIKKNINLSMKDIESEDDDDDIDFDLDDEEKNKIRVGDKKRNGVCSELYVMNSVSEIPRDLKEKEKEKEKEKDKDKEKENPREKKNEYKLKNIKKSPEDENFIKAYLLRSFLFDSLEPDDMRKIINAMEPKDIMEGTFIIKQGEYEKNMFFIREGTCECQLNFEKPQIKDPKQKIKKPKEYTPLRLVREYNPGDMFCELSLLYLNKSPGRRRL